MTPHTNVLLDTTGAPVTGSQDGSWFAVPFTDRTHNILQVTVKAGTGTVVLEGRTGAEADPVQIATETATAAEVAAAFPQVRARVTGGTALSVVVTIDRPSKPIS